MPSLPSLFLRSDPSGWLRGLSLCVGAVGGCSTIYEVLQYVHVAPPASTSSQHP